ncbi:pectinesterase [Ranunculus cassubicifolius]
MIQTLALAFLLVFSSHSFLVHTYDLHSSQLLVPSPVFISTINSTIANVIIAQRKVEISATEIKDVGESYAINNCAELLDYTVDDLSASRSLIDNQSGEFYGTGNNNADLKAWLSAVIANQETCIEGLEMTSSSVKNDIVNTLQQIQSQVSNLLGMVPNISSPIQSAKRKPSKVHSVTVSKDGSGNFTSIMDAVLSAPDNSENKFVIYVKKGVYIENVEIGKNKWNLVLIGDGMNKTVISGNRSVGVNMTTYATATFSVTGKRFKAQDITFENTAGPLAGQAVALRSNSDLSAFYRCAFLGFQDTLYVHSNRQFYRECVISGTVDFIFGKGTAVFQNCSIYVRNGHDGHDFDTVTAHSRLSPNQTTGFAIQFSTINSDMYNIACGLQSTYLGRPWREYARSVVMQSYLSDIIKPEGWVEWNNRTSTKTVYYGEFKNDGPGANLEDRVKWRGYHVMNKDEANKFTVKNLINGDLWLPETGIKYTKGLEVKNMINYFSRF